MVYTSNGCGYCTKLKKMLTDANVIDKVTLVENGKLPDGVQGVPHIESRTTKKHHTGCPKSVEALIKSLSEEGKIRENFINNRRPLAHVPNIRKGNIIENYQSSTGSGCCNSRCCSDYYNYNNYLKTGIQIQESLAGGAVPPAPCNLRSPSGYVNELCPVCPQIICPDKNQARFVGLPME